MLKTIEYCKNDFEYDVWGQKPTKTSRKIENE